MTLVATMADPGPDATPARPGLGGLSFVLAGVAPAIPPACAELRSLAMLVVGLAGAAVSIVAGYFFLARRGLWRWMALVVFVLAPVAVVLVFAFTGLLWVALASAAAWLLAAA